jgi:hypothetical protein
VNTSAPLRRRRTSSTVRAASSVPVTLTAPPGQMLADSAA